MKTKSILTTTMMLLCCQYVMAAEVTQEQALQNAKIFLIRNIKTAKSKRLTLSATKEPELQVSKSEQTRYYAFNVGEDSGFILVSADDRVPAILGYAESGTFDSQNIPDNFRWWLEEYERRLNNLDQNETLNASSTIHIPIEPMISSQWNQNEPYWNECPTDSYTNEKCYSGCVATAMAQILNFHKYPQKTIGTIPAYETKTRGIKIPTVKQTNIDWDNMLSRYDETSNTASQQAVATLMYLCGTAVEMDYSSSGSGSNGIKASLAMRNVFGYDENMRFLNRHEYDALTWNEIVYSELSAGRPILYMGQSVGGGHAFVVDGYRENDYYHVNWGWGGSCDGYFLLSILNPYSNEGIGSSTSTDGYSTCQQILIGIQPPTELSAETDNLTTSYFYVDEDLIDTEWSRDSTGGFTVPFYYSYRNNALSSKQFESGIGIYNQNGQLVETHVISDCIFEPLANIGDTIISPSIAQDLPAGDYVIKGISRRNEANGWMENICSDMWNVLANVSDTMLRLTTPFYHYDARLEVLTENPMVGEPLTIRAHLKNYGMLQHETFYLMANGTYMAGQQFEVNANDSVDIIFVYLPTKSGTNTIIKNRLL